MVKFWGKEKSKAGRNKEGDASTWTLSPTSSRASSPRPSLEKSKEIKPSPYNNEEVYTKLVVTTLIKMANGFVPVLIDDTTFSDAIRLPFIKFMLANFLEIVYGQKKYQEIEEINNKLQVLVPLKNQLGRPEFNGRLPALLEENPSLKKSFCSFYVIEEKNEILFYYPKIDPADDQINYNHEKILFTERKHLEKFLEALQGIKEQMVEINPDVMADCRKRIEEDATCRKSQPPKLRNP